MNFKFQLGQWFQFQIGSEGCFVSGAVITLVLVVVLVTTCATYNHMFSPACGAGGQCYVSNSTQTSTQTLPTP